MAVPYHPTGGAVQPRLCQCQCPGRWPSDSQPVTSISLRAPSPSPSSPSFASTKSHDLPSPPRCLVRRTVSYLRILIPGVNKRDQSNPDRRPVYSLALSPLHTVPLTTWTSTCGRASQHRPIASRPIHLDCTCHNRRLCLASACAFLFHLVAPPALPALIGPDQASQPRSATWPPSPPSRIFNRFIFSLSFSTSLSWHNSTSFCRTSPHPTQACLEAPPPPKPSISIPLLGSIKHRGYRACGLAALCQPA